MTLTRAPIDVAPAVETFQTLALIGVRHWLSVAQPEGRVDPEGVHDMAALLVGSDAPGRFSFVRRFAGAWLVHEPPKFTQAQARWVSDRHQRGWFSRAFDVLAQLGRRLSGRPAPVAFAPVAPLLGQAIDVMALRDHTFKRNLAMVFRSHLRVRVIMHPDTGQPPELSAPVLWAAAAQGAALTSAATWLEKALEAYAKALAKQGEWATFWDVYALSQPAAKGRSPATTALPLSLTEGTEKQAKLYRKGWRDDLPAYAVQLVAGTL